VECLGISLLVVLAEFNGKSKKKDDGSAFKFVPTVDGYVIPRNPEQMLAAGEFSNVTWLTGLDRDEGMLYAGGTRTTDLHQRQDVNNL
jgi:carboxylesterase type B